MRKIPIAREVERVAGSLFVKICGIMNLPDAECAVDAGADALGFIFYPKSPRFLDVEKASRLLRDLPKEVVKVGVFVDEPHGFLEQYIDELPLDYVQLHGQESPDYCSDVSAKVIKGLRIINKNDIMNVGDYRVSFYLLDAFSEVEFGGTGNTFDWKIALEAKKVLASPIILSGGLNPGNVAEAVRLVNPYGVDVSSGVEISPGVKDHMKIREFVNNAREARQRSVEDN
jgi:phosphoribosylanthranilate isomerase